MLRADQGAHSELESMSAAERLRWAVARYGRSEIVLSSSFGADSAVLLHLARSVDPGLRIALIDTGFLFPETLDYVERLRLELGLNISCVRAPLPDDPPPQASCTEGGEIWCACRKVEAMEVALRGVKCWISGLRRDQAPTRADVPVLERQLGGLVKLHPIADWDQERVAAYQREHGLPQHPLVERGYSSIGCMPCTRLPVEGEGRRSGRWRGQDRTECGLHERGRVAGAAG